MGPCEHRATCFIDIIHLVAYYYKHQDTFSLKFPPIRTKKKSVRGSGDLNSNHEKKTSITQSSTVHSHTGKRGNKTHIAFPVDASLVED